MPSKPVAKVLSRLDTVAKISNKWSAAQGEGMTVPSHHNRVVRQAQVSLSRGWRVIPLRPRSKVPREKDWPNQVVTDADLKGSFMGDANIGVVLGKASGGLADVDLDVAEAIAVASKFLPPTDRMHGRANRRHSHAFYLTTEILKPEKFVDVDGTMLVEVRSEGQQTMIPPSIHPTGEALTWEKNGDPSRVHAKKLRRTVGRVAAGALLARHWPARGKRHDVAMALSGALLRGGWSLDWAMRFVGAIGQAAGDEEWRAREKDVRTTAQRLADNREATGVPSLSEIVGEEVVAKALEWLAVDRSVAIYDVAEARINAPWPDPPAREAFYGLAGDIVRAIEPHSEADPAALLGQFLVAFGSAIGRRAHFHVEDDYHYANIFVAIVGETSKARKGTSLAHIRKLFREAASDWDANCVQSGLASGEGLIYAVRDPVLRRRARKRGKLANNDDDDFTEVEAGVYDKRLLVVESEFAQPLKLMSREGNILSTVMRQAWDTGELRTLTKNSPTRATGAHISIVGHITQQELLRHLSETEQANGFGNRLIWLCARRSKCLPDGGRVPGHEFDGLAARLGEAVLFAGRVREMRRSEKARKLWHQIYPALSEGKPGLFGALTGRAEAQVLRLSMIYALLDCSATILVQHIRAGLALWKYAEASVRYVFGDPLGDATADTILLELRRSPEGLTRTEVSSLFSRHLPASEIGRALNLLLKEGLARCERNQTEGRTLERWFAIVATAAKKGG